MTSRTTGGNIVTQIQCRLTRMATEICELLDSDDGHTILITQIVTEKPSSCQKKVAYLEMERVSNGTLGLELSQARTVQVHGKDCSKTCLQITNILMDADGTSSPAMAAGLKKGDIVTRCGRDEATCIKGLLDSVRNAQKGNMTFLVLEYCRLSRFGFLKRDLEDARAEIEERCYQTALQSMLDEHVNAPELRGLSPAELYGLFPSPFGRNAGSIVREPDGGGLAWSGRIVQTQPVATSSNFLQFGSELTRKTTARAGEQGFISQSGTPNTPSRSRARSNSSGGNSSVSVSSRSRGHSSSTSTSTSTGTTASTSPGFGSRSSSSHNDNDNSSRSSRSSNTTWRGTHRLHKLPTFASM